jgi:diguanylate cyclase (GGDEF)-like protein
MNPESESRGSSLASRYTRIGILLGVAAPGGALLLRVLAGADLGTEWDEHAFFYTYMLAGTCGVFGIAGYLTGRRADRLKRGRDEFQRLAEIDPLTKLPNAGAFGKHYRRVVEHASRFGEPVSLLIVDVDRLKAWNDELGHGFGSAVLLRVAAVLEASKRDADQAARWGGDEFTLLMPGAGADAARRLAETIAERVAGTPVIHGGFERAATVTVGAATWSGGGEPPNLFDVADRALYEGKREGRGGVHCVEVESRVGRTERSPNRVNRGGHF